MCSKELIKEFNEKFNANVSYDTLLGRLQRVNENWQRNICAGEVNWIYKPIGSEAIHRGEVYIKKSDIVGKKRYRENWVRKDRYIYEQTYNCKLDSNKDVLVHLDGNPLNCDIDNLRLVYGTSINRYLKRNNIYALGEEMVLATIECLELQTTINKMKKETRNEKYF